MARIKNSSFVGVNSQDVARDASIYARTLSNVAGDLALVLDKATGQNGQTPIDHSGTAGLGSTLGMPITNQTINRSLKLAGGANASYAVLVVPIYCPAGITAYRLEIDFDSARPTTVELRDTSWVKNTEFVLRQTITGDGVIYDSGFGIQVTAGSWAYLIVSRVLSQDSTGASDRSLGWRLTPIYDASFANGAIPPTSTAVGSPYDVNTTFTPSTMTTEEIDSDMVVSTYALDAYVTTRLNRMINTAWEYITGGKIPGNNLTNVTTMWDASRASFASEGLPQFPMFATATGCAHYDNVSTSTKNTFLGATLTSSPTTGPTDRVRYPTAQAASITVARTRGYTPKFPATAGTSKLACRVLAYAYDSDSLAAWSATMATAAGSVTAAFTQIGATNWWTALLTAIPFSQETRSNFTLSLSHSAPGVLTQELLLTGYTMAFTA